MHSDKNTPAIVSALRKAGCVVRQLDPEGNSYGGGLPDLLVARKGVTYLLEVKTPRGRLTDAQKRFHAEWTGGPLAVVHTVEEALAAVGLGAEVAA